MPIPVFVRILMNIMILAMLAVILGGGAWLHQTRTVEEQDLTLARTELLRLHREIMLRRALAEVEELNERGYPVTVDPEWFDGNLPHNPLLSAANPWLEIAAEKHASLEHPPDRVAVSGSHGAARFWYNPYAGVVRARVPQSTSDAAALRMYNTVNASGLRSLFDGPEY